MAKRVKMRLLPNWAPDDDLDGPATFFRTDSRKPGALQVSLRAEYVGGKPPQPTHQDLIEMVQEYGERHDTGELVETASGTCQLGTFGTAVFRSAEYPHIQLWLLSNGYDFVLATHVCCAEPEPAEIAEAQEIVSMIELSEGARRASKG